MKNRETRIKKLRRLTAVVLAAFIFASNLTFGSLNVFGEEPEISIDIEVKDAVLPGNTFEVQVTVKNNTGSVIQGVKIDEDKIIISHPGTFNLTFGDYGAYSIDEGKSRVFSFYFKADEKAGTGDISVIGFTVDYELEDTEKSETGTIQVRVADSTTPPPPVTEPPTEPPTLPAPTAPPTTNPPPPAGITSNVTIQSVSISGSVRADSAFSATVTVRNGNNRAANIRVGTDISNQLVSVSSFNSFTENIAAESTRTFTFMFAANSSDIENDTSQIRFNVWVGENLLDSAVRTVTVNTPVPQPELKPYFEIVSIASQPQRAAAGDNIKVSFAIRLMNAASNNIRISTTSPAGISPVSPSVLSPVGMLTSGSVYRGDFAFEIKNNAEIGYNELRFTVETSDGSVPSIIYPVGVVVDKSQAAINIPDVKITSVSLPESVTAGGAFQIKALLENSGGDAENVRVTIVPPVGIANTSTNIIQIDSLKQNARREIIFDMVVTKSAAEFYNLIQIQTEFLHKTEEAEERIQTSQYAGFNVVFEEEPDEEAIIKDFTLDMSIPPAAAPGSEFQVSVKVQNNGSDAKNLLLKVTPQLAGVENRTVNNIAIPELKSGESVTKEISFFVPESSGGAYCAFETELTGNNIDSIRQFAGTVITGLNQPKVIIENIKIPRNVNRGEVFNAEITIANNGGAQAENIILTINPPPGIQNRTSGILKTDSLASGGKETHTVSFIAAKNAAYGYNPFSLELSYESKAGPVNDKISQYFGVTVNSSDLIIESVKLPDSVGINRDFEVEVAVRNTGADATDATLSLSAQGGLINKTSNIVRIDSVKAGETITRKFVFMAHESSPAGDNYAAIEVSLNYGEETIRQYSGTIVRNPSEKDKDGETNNDIPVVIISRFSYVNTDGDTENTGNSNNNPGEEDSGFDYNFDNNFDFDFGIDTGDINIFENTSVIIERPMPAPARPMPSLPGIGDDSGQGGGGSGAAPLNPAHRDTNAVYGGKSFVFTLELKNMHKSIAVRDLKITVSQEKGIFNPKAGSNTFFVEWLEPGETTEISLELLVKSDADPDSYGLTVSMSYRNEKGDSTSASEIINIPVQQEMRFNIGELPFISDIEMGDEAYINVQFGNRGRSWIYNVVVTVQGDGFMNQYGPCYAGHLEGGKNFSHEFALTPFSPGFLNGVFVFTYEDSDGNVYEEQAPFFFSVIGDMGDMWGDDMPNWGDDGIIYGPDGLPVMNPDGEEGEGESEGFWLFTNMNFLKWAIIAAGCLIIIGSGAAVTIFILKIKNKKSIGYDGNDDDDGGDSADA